MLSTAVSRVPARTSKFHRRNRAALNFQHESLVKGLFQLVWADDVVSPNEVEALTAILLRLGYSLSETICLLDSNLAAPPPSKTDKPLDQLFGPDLPTREELKFLLMIGFSEGSIGPEQLGYIEGLILRMGLTATELDQLRIEAVKELNP